MPAIKQDDLVANISFTRAYLNLFSISVTTGITIPANVLNAAQGTIYSENKSISNTYPLWVKSNGTSSQGWMRESDWQIHNQSITNATILFYNAGANTTITPTVQNITISVGTAVGIYGAGAWGAAGNLNTSRYVAGMVGGPNSALIGGGTGTVLSALSTSELYNGSAWIFAANMNITRKVMAACGSQNAALFAGGSAGAALITRAEVFNGSSWSFTAGNLTISAGNTGGAGGAVAAIVTGGIGLSVVQLYNGTSWTLGANLNVSRNSHVETGSQNSSMISGGVNADPLKTTEIFNGSSWSFSGNMNITRKDHAGCGTVNAAIESGGLDSTSGQLTSSEVYNGSSWSSSGNMTSARDFPSGCGSQNNSIVAGGFGAAGLITSEAHTQTLYRPLNYQHYKTAKNIGIVAQNPGGATATTISIAFSGYINNSAFTSNNIAITTAAQFNNTYLVLSPNSTTTAITGASDGSINKTITTITNQDIILGLNLSNTEIVMLGNTLVNLSPWVRW